MKRRKTVNIGVLGTGMVGNAIGTALVKAGNSVRMGSRIKDNPKALEWANAAGTGTAKGSDAEGFRSQGTFADAARFGEVVFNCTSGAGSLEALRLVDEGNLRGKILLDVANPLDFSAGFPPSLLVCNTDSLGERIQKALPGTKVVKTLNTMNCNVMVNPGLVPGDHTVFVSGNDPQAKRAVTAWLAEWFGWKPSNIIDLGDIATARGTEMYVPLWAMLFGSTKNPNFNVRVVQGPKPAA